MGIKVQMMSLGVYDTATIRALFANELHYRTNYKNVNYDVFPDLATWSDPHGYNSNSFAFGLLKAAGISVPNTGYGKSKPFLPGKGNPVPKKYFESTSSGGRV